MEIFLADTTVLIDHLRGVEQAKTFLKQNTPHISHVTVAELIEGAKNKNHLRQVNQAVSDLPHIPISEPISSKALSLMEKYFLSHKLELPDALIAATAMEENLTLMTGNTKHFSFIKGLKLLDWSQA
jgi:predicted nucleic acid-binding protein